MGDTFTKLNFSVDLTEYGFEDYETVIKRILASVEKMKNLPIKERFFDELKKMWTINFDFHIDDDITDFTSETAGSMHDGFEPEQILVGDYLLEKFDEEII